MNANDDWGDRPSDLTECPFCSPMAETDSHSLLIQELDVSWWRLSRDQGNRGACLLIFKIRHAETVEDLSPDDFLRYCRDLHFASRCIKELFRPDHVNYALLGNVVPHLHWHIIPRYKSEPRWGKPIWTTRRGEMQQKYLSQEEYELLLHSLRVCATKTQA